MLKICFQLVADSTWRFGAVYLKDLFCALQKTKTSHLNLCLLAQNSWQSIPEDLGGKIEVLNYSLPARWTMQWFIDRFTQRLLRRDLRQEFFLRHQGVNLLVCWHPPLGLELPTLSIIPDFQHIHLPDMFGFEERKTRDRSYLETARRATRIIIWSESVRRDLGVFAPQFVDKARVINPVSCIPDSIYQDNPQGIVDYYHLPRKFVYLPNQFWKHKNHSLVFLALKILEEKGMEIALVCSGYPGDNRHPTYFSDLLHEIALLNIRNQVVLLGSIPHDHVLRLMRQSICVLNPSLFEGYGMTVEEARSLGKQLLVSDIPAHREQKPLRVTYFDPHDSKDLAMKLEQVWCNTVPGPDLELEAEARASLPKRIITYAESFMSVVQEVVVSAY